MRTIIAGSRKGAIERYVVDGAARLQALTGLIITEVVCGMAPGADLLGKAWAEAAGVKVRRMPANWKPDGPDGPTDRGAGHKRNRAMGLYADALIAIWDGQSKGTKGMIDFALRQGLAVIVLNYGGGILDVTFQRATK